MKTIRLLLYPLLVGLLLLKAVSANGQITTTITLISPHTVCAGHTGDLVLEWTATDSGNQQDNYELRIYAGNVTSVNANTASLQRISLNATYIQTTSPRKLRATISMPSLANGSQSRFAIFNKVLTNTTNNTSNLFEILTVPSVFISLNSTVQVGNPAQVLLTFSGNPPFSFEYNNYTPQDAANNYAPIGVTTPTFSHALSIVIPVTNQIPFSYDNRYVRNLKNALGCAGTVSGASQITLAKFTLNTSVSQAALCAGANLTVSYSLQNPSVVLQTSFRPRVLLSDANGSFNNPTQLGDGTVSNKQVNVTIPTTVTPGSNYRIQIVAVNPDENLYLIPASTPINITKATTPTVTTPASPCQGGAGVTLQASGSGTINWFDSNGAKQPGTPTQSTGNAGTFGYKVSQTINGCESDKVDVSVTIKAKSNAPSTNQTLTYCQNQGADVLSANGPNLIWYDASRSSLGASAPRPSTGSIGQQKFFVSRDENGCRSDLTEITVNVTAPPSAPGVSNPSPVCQYKDAPALLANEQNLRWYRQESGGNSEGAIKPGTDQSGTTAFWVSQVVNNCEGPRAKIEQTVNPASPDPGVTSPVQLCQYQSAPALTAQAQNPRWYDAGNTFISTDAPKPPTDQVRDITYKVSQTSNGCESKLVSLVIQVRGTPVAPGVADITVCHNAPAPSLMAQGNDVRWYTAETGGVGSASSPAISTAQVGDQTFWVSQKFGSCEGLRARLQVRIVALPQAPVVTNPNAVCQYTDVPVLTAQGQNVRWYRQETGGNFEGSIKPGSDSDGKTSFWVSQFVNNCEGPRAKIEQTINPASPDPTTATLLLCRDQTAPSLTAVGQNLRWYDGGNTFISTTAPKPPTDQVRDITYKVSQTSNGCESKLIALLVQVRNIPGAPDVVPLSLCQNQVPQSLTAAGTGLVWYDQATGGTSTSTLTPQTTTLGQRTYWVAQQFGICEGPRAVLVTTVYAIPAAPVASDRTSCINDTPTALTATGQNLRWYDGSGTAKPSIVPPTSIGQSLSYVVTQTQNGCESAGKTVNVRTITRATVRLTGDSAIILYDSTAIRLRFDGDAPWRVRLWDGKTVTTSVSPFVKWEKPTQPGKITYEVQALDNDCGAGQILNKYQLIVLAPLAIEPVPTADFGLQVYPVPASQEITVAWMAPVGSAVSLQLVNPTGQVSWQRERRGTGNRETALVDLSKQSAGVLIMKLLVNNYPAKFIKLIKL